MKSKAYTKLWEWQQRSKKEDLSCAKCGRVGLMTLDHIVPIWFIDSLGLKVLSYEHDWNFQYLCRACNTLKGSKFDPTDPRTFDNLRRYVDIATEFYSPTPPTL